MYNSVSVSDFKRCSEDTMTQECIPVGCVPSARYVRGGGFLTETLLDRDPLGQGPHPEQNDTQV